MPDLSEQIRNYVDDGIEEVTPEEILSRTTRIEVPAPALLHPIDSATNRKRRSARWLLIGVCVAVALAGVGIFVAVGPRSQNGNTSLKPGGSTASTETQIPADINGTEESLNVVSTPSFFAQARSLNDCWNVISGPTSFTVDQTPPFVVWTGSGRGSNTWCGTQTTTLLTLNGAGDINDSLHPVSAVIGSSTTSMFSPSQGWGSAVQWLYVWTGLPADAAFVTYSYSNQTFWEQPADGVAAFVVPPLFTPKTLYSVLHSLPFPVVSAYDSNGTLIGQAFAPREGGDDYAIGDQIVLGSDGVGAAQAGEDQQQAVSTMTRLLGSPTSTTPGDCTGRTEVEWGDLSLEFDDGYLSGYRYLEGGLSSAGATSEPQGAGSPLLKTATGATLGMTLAQVRSLYPAADFSTAEGGSIYVRGQLIYDRLFLGFFAQGSSAVLTEIKGGATCGDS